jgi:hypothetical protein
MSKTIQQFILDNHPEGLEKARDAISVEQDYHRIATEPEGIEEYTHAYDLMNLEYTQEDHDNQQPLIDWQQRRIDLLEKAIIGFLQGKGNEEASNRIICELHLMDSFGNKSTLTCRLKAGRIRYTYFSSWNGSGVPYSLSNLQCQLPMETRLGETEDEFIENLIRVINKESVVTVKHLAKKTTFV